MNQPLTALLAEVSASLTSTKLARTSTKLARTSTKLARTRIKLAPTSTELGIPYRGQRQLNQLRLDLTRYQCEGVDVYLQDETNS